MQTPIRGWPRRSAAWSLRRDDRDPRGRLRRRPASAVGTGRRVPASGRRPGRRHRPAPPAPAQRAPGSGRTASGRHADGGRVPDGTKIIRTGSLQLEVADVRPRSPRPGPRSVGDGRLHRRVAAVPRRRQRRRDDHLPDPGRPLGGRARRACAGSGTEVGEQTDAADVTGQIVDLDARIRNLRASETALVRHLAERRQGRRRARDRGAPVRRPRPDRAARRPEGEPGRPGRLRDARPSRSGSRSRPSRRPPNGGIRRAEVDQAGASLVGFLQALASAGIWFAIVWLPILLDGRRSSPRSACSSRAGSAVLRPTPPDAAAAAGRRRRADPPRPGARPRGTMRR